MIIFYILATVLSTDLSYIPTGKELFRHPVNPRFSEKLDAILLIFFFADSRSSLILSISFQLIQAL